MKPWFNGHTHTMYSSIRLLDATNKPKDIIETSIKLGLSGVCITDHESLSSHVEFEKLSKEYPDFKIALGNEIYLTDSREMGQRYWHFLLMAKNAEGHRALRELSSNAWYYSYFDRGMERVPTLKSELAYVAKKYPGSLIITSACRGSEVSTAAFNMMKARQMGDTIAAEKYYKQITNFMDYILPLFGEDFYLELNPSNDEEQILINQTLVNIANAYGIKNTVSCDAHYLRPENRPSHKTYLQSKGGEREVDDFYSFTYLMSYDEVFDLLKLGLSEEKCAEILQNTLEIQDKIQPYSLFHKQNIPSVKSKYYPAYQPDALLSKYPTLLGLCSDKDNDCRSWITQCVEKLKENGKYNDIYLARLEEEARVKTVIGAKLETNMFRYPITLQHYVDLIWECGSMIGAGRGSSCSGLNHYLLGITQLDPIVWDFPFFRYLNDERVELGDIDIDLSPSKKASIIDAVRSDRRDMIHSEYDWVKNLCGCVMVATFGTEGTRSAVLSAARGYRSAEYPEGIDVDEAQYLTSLIPSERGFLWPIHDVIHGNKEKDRKPVYEFIKTIKTYPGLLETVEEIEGLVNKRSSHASGVIFFEGDPFEHCAFMKTPKGELITQYDLECLEYMGNTKYDFLVTSVQDMLAETIHMLQADKVIEPELTLRQAYDKYFHPNILPLTDQRYWTAFKNQSVLNVFQFDSTVGAQAVSLLQPSSIQEMTDANGLLRLMGEKGEERPMDKYKRFKDNIKLWYQEMDRAGLTKEEQTYLEPYFKQSYGVPPSQEQLMLMLMDKNICHFSLGEANAARKIVGKKQMSKIPALKEKVLTQAKSRALGEYVWKYGAGPQMGYSFSSIHSGVYSIIGFQCVYAATRWPAVYWNTACLKVNAGALDSSEDDTAKYAKLAKAIGEIRDSGVKVSLVDINDSTFGFKPDAANNRILFGLKGMVGVGDDVVDSIIKNRPYTSLADFITRVNPNKTVAIALIKAGAFDKFGDRKELLWQYLGTTADTKAKLNGQNLPMLMSKGYIPDTLKEQKRVYNFNQYLKDKCAGDKDNFDLDDRAISFLVELSLDDMLDGSLLSKKQWTKKYNKLIQPIKDYLAVNQEAMLKKVNDDATMEEWKKYAGRGNESAWEMEVLGFYYHQHELTHVNNLKYGISNYKLLPTSPIVERTFQSGDREFSIYRLQTIAGTVIAADKNHSSFSLLTVNGVVNVKLRKEVYAFYTKQISSFDAKGDKHIEEKSWLNRGTILLVQGVRQGDTFVAKKYAKSPLHELTKITEITDKGELILQEGRLELN